MYTSESGRPIELVHAVCFKGGIMTHGIAHLKMQLSWWCVGLYPNHPRHKTKYYKLAIRYSLPPTLNQTKKNDTIQSRFMVKGFVIGFWYVLSPHLKRFLELSDMCQSHHKNVNSTISVMTYKSHFKLFHNNVNSL